MNGNIMHSILTNQERRIFELIINNKSTEEIAYMLNVSPKTVRNHISNVIQKLGVKGRAHAVVELIRLNEIAL
ncbi:MAG: helix-turn-helix transcriptional regulator [Bacilli bacterium]|nr:helix-turn-helix transcriptional regulator [Bacilli bacterium]